MEKEKTTKELVAWAFKPIKDWLIIYTITIILFNVLVLYNIIFK